MKGRHFLLVLASAALLPGCAAWKTAEPVSPSSYQVSRSHIPRTVGKLRRLAILPIAQQPPHACRSTSNGEAAIALPLGDAGDAALFLSKQKGYEIVSLAAERYPAWLDNSVNQEFVSEVIAWSAQTRDDAPIGPLLSSLAEQVGEGERVDGILLLHVEDSCARANTAGRTLLGIASLGASEVLVDPKLQEVFPVYRAAIIETAGKRPAWRNTVDMAWSGLRVYFSLSGKAKPFSEYLFEDLEPAVPKMLTR